jgi:protocatechuate 3,4-dioxygenase beta subunit
LLNILWLLSFASQIDDKLSQQKRKRSKKMENPDIFDLGLNADLQMWQQPPLGRRRFLQMGAATLALFLAGCQSIGNTDSTEPTTTDTADTTSGGGEACVSEIPQETTGPYPADGSQASNQMLNALALSGIVRSDIRTSLGTGNMAEGIPCTIELTLVNTNEDCAPLANNALYIWHCDRDSNYSMYSSAAVAEDYLRGVQVADSDGKVTFTSIFPACYAGRWPHMHFEIYPSLAEATDASNVLHTSQLAIPKDICDAAYTTDGYAQSVRNLSQISLESDNVFGDGVSSQMATVTGDVGNGYTIQLTVGVAA